MKKIIYLMMIIMCINSVYAYNFSTEVNSAINEDDRVSYSYLTRKWSRNILDKDYVFTKHMTKGSGGFSEYEYNNNFYDTDTTYEFLHGTELIGCNIHKLKFYYMFFDGEKFVKRELTDDQIKSYFPEVELIKISDFINNKITLHKPFFKTKTYMLVNDTDRDFYKYSFENYENDDTLFRNIFTVRRPRTLIYSHFKGRSKDMPPLKITIKGQF